MRATKAYIASLGTTGVLVASSALLLVVVSALVAFNAWPGGDPIGGIKGLVVDDRHDSLQLTGPARVAADAAPAAAAVAAAPTPSAAAPAPGSGSLSAPVPSAGGPGGGERFSPPRSTTESPAVHAPTGSPAGPPIPVPAPDVQGVSRGLGGTVEQVTGDTGKAVGQVNPDLGRGVTDTGKALSQIVQGIGVTVQQKLSAPSPP